MLYVSSTSAARRTGLLMLFWVFSIFHAYTQRVEGEWKDTAFIRQFYQKTNADIPMRDGVTLHTSIYSPRDHSVDYPVIFNRTPYGIESSSEAFSRLLPEYSHFLEAGYIIVLQDVRGRFMSEGTFLDVRPYQPFKKEKETDENSDTWDSIDWLIHNLNNCNGKVGMIGVSYPGFYTTISIPDAHPALKAVSPQAPVTDWFMGDDWHHHGAFFMMDAFNFYSIFGLPRQSLTRKWSATYDFGSEDNYDFFRKLGSAVNAQKEYFDDSIQFWPELMQHTAYDEFWKARNPLRYLTSVKPAILVVGGWFDAEDLYGTLLTYKTIEDQNPNAVNTLIMGPWAHHQWAVDNGEHLGNIVWGSSTSDHFNELELAFFNHYLKDQENSSLPEASVFITGDNHWHNFASWPPETAKDTSLYLHAGGGITFKKPEKVDPYDEYISDPCNPVPYTITTEFKRNAAYMTADQRFASRRPDVMVYQTEPLDDEVTLTGPLQVDLYISTSGTDADFVVKLIDVFPQNTENLLTKDADSPAGGYQMLIRGDVMRGRYRNSYEKAEPFIPGEITRVSFEMPDVAHCFKKGHCIMVQVQNSWFPLVDRNPQQFIDIYRCSDKDYIKATQRIYHDASYPSCIHIKIWK